MICEEKTASISTPDASSTSDSSHEGQPVCEDRPDRVEPERVNAESVRTKRARRPVRIGDALRTQGLDEREVARKFADVVARHTPAPDEANEGSADKLLVDVLKECLRHLENSPSSDFPPPKLVHKVPRPRRAESGNKNTKKKQEST